MTVSNNKVFIVITKLGKPAQLINTVKFITSIIIDLFSPRGLARRLFVVNFLHIDSECTCKQERICVELSTMQCSTRKE